MGVSGRVGGLFFGNVSYVQNWFQGEEIEFTDHLLFILCHFHLTGRLGIAEGLDETGQKGIFRRRRLVTAL